MVDLNIQGQKHIYYILNFQRGENELKMKLFQPLVLTIPERVCSGMPG